MRKDKEIAIKLRNGGKSFNEISTLISIPRSTLSNWFKNDKRSLIVTTINRSKVNNLHKERLRKMNEVRAQKLAAHYQNAVEEARKEYSRYERDSLFVAGLMLYASEGDKSIKGTNIKIANTDPALLRIFIVFSLKYLRIEPQKVKFWLLLYPDLSEVDCRNKWKAALGISDENFYKNQVINGKLKNKRLLYGVGNITIVGKYNKVKLLEWIRIASKELIGEKYAGMV